MRPWMARATGALLVAVAAAALATLSAWPMHHAPAATSLLRLDWRLRGEEAGECLRATAEELAGLPAHMRNPEACLGALPPYRLRVWIDDGLVLDEVVRGGGAREDRPLTVYRDLPMTPGQRRLRATFERESVSNVPGTSARVATALRVAADADVEPGRVLLMVRRQDDGTLEVRRPLP